MIPTPLTRPSHKECTAKIKQLRDSLGAGDWLSANEDKLDPELEELGCVTEAERLKLLQTLALEITADAYEGSKPPMRSYELTCKNAELFAFAWNSPSIAKNMYFKFCFVGTSLYIVSVHVSKPKGTRS